MLLLFLEHELFELYFFWTSFSQIITNFLLMRTPHREWKVIQTLSFISLAKGGQHQGALTFVPRIIEAQGYVLVRHLGLIVSCSTVVQ